MTGRYKDRWFSCLGCGETSYGPYRPDKRYCTAACYHHTQLGTTRPGEWGAKISTSLKEHGKGASPTKVCPMCKEELPRTNFPVRSNGHTASYCFPCGRLGGAAKTRKYLESHPEKRDDMRVTNRRTTLRKNYSLSVEAFEKMKAAQKGKCAICGEKPSGRRQNATLHVDHCHETGLIRGLLCGGCNSMLGYAKDNPDTLAAGIAYLNMIGGLHGPRYVNEGSRIIKVKAPKKAA